MFLKNKLNSTNFLTILIFFIALFVSQIFGNRGVFPIDSFSHFDTGYRVLNGELPFRDYWAVSGPLIDFFQAFLFFVFGINWQIYLLSASILNGFFAVLTFNLLLKFKLEKKFSFFYAICLAVLAYPSSGTSFVDHHSTFLSVISIYFLIFAIKTEKLIYWFFLPLVFSFAFLSKQVPATYIFFSVCLLIFYDFIFNYKNKLNKKKIFLTLVFSSTVIIILLIFFLNFGGISIQNFIDQYINYPREIGKSRYTELNYDFNNIVLNFKFIYLFFILLFIVNLKKLFTQKQFYKKINFKLFLISFLLFVSLVQHQIVTKNQIFIFFLIPLFAAFVHIELLELNNKYKKYIIFFLISMCLYTTFKYHKRFNLERKFHELNNVNFSNSVDAAVLDKKFKGLNWITPGSRNKEDVFKEIKSIKENINILKKDNAKKMLITNYSFFSVILNETVNSPSRWFPGDDSAFPQKDSSSFHIYKKFLLKNIKDKKIEVIYIIKDVSERNLLDYIDLECVNKIIINKHMDKYTLNRNCSDLYGKQ
tara:strand:- start:1604 stop:3205 length:1602 start_codon:yes stop_codon:yes gene_type:complete